MAVSTDVLLARLFARSRLRQWQLIHEIGTLGHLQRAAEAVGMSQPSATHALAEIERLLGFELFERHARGMRPTAACEALLPRVRAALAAFGDCAEIASELSTGGRGELRIGAIGAGIGGLVSEAVAGFSARHPSVAVGVVQQPPAQLLAALHEGALDLVVARCPPALPAGIHFEPLLSDHYVVACSAQHPLARRPAVTREELLEQLWLLPPRSTVAERDFHRAWEGGVLPHRLCRVESRAPVMMWTMLERRQALTLIPRNSARPWLAAGLLVALQTGIGPALEPVGALYAAAAATDGDSRSALVAFLATLRTMGDTGGGLPQ